MIPNPLSVTTTEADETALVALAQAGNRDALEQLVTRHQSWIYNVVLRMVYLPQDAEDITQEILIKLITKLSTFEGRSAFRTWLLKSAPDEGLPDPRAVPVDLQLLVEESKIGCTSSGRSSRGRAAICITSWTASAAWSTRPIPAGARTRRRRSCAPAMSIPRTCSSRQAI